MLVLNPVLVLVLPTAPPVIQAPVAAAVRIPTSATNQHPEPKRFIRVPVVRALVRARVVLVLETRTATLAAATGRSAAV